MIDSERSRNNRGNTGPAVDEYATQTEPCDSILTFFVIYKDNIVGKKHPF